MIKLLFLLLLIGAAGPVRAQAVDPYRWESPRYQVLTDESADSAREIGEKMEAALRLYSGYFHFAPAIPPYPLRVRIFRDKTGFDEYLGAIVSGIRRDFVFISYPDPRRNELVGFRQEPADFDASLLHQGFAQYLKSFIPGAPAWLQAGMAAYLERAEYDPARGEFRFRPNLSWLPTLKRIFRGESPEPRFPVGQLVAMDKEQASAHLEAFYAQAWGLVYFLIHSADRDYNRVLWDTISALDAARSPGENAERVRERAFSWIDEVVFRDDFESFIFSQHTFAEHVQAGVELYSTGRLQEAAGSFHAARELEAAHPLPCYYLGLIHYALRQYDRADEEYQRALRLGSEAGLIHYALGINAFADRRYDDAAELLGNARESNPVRYGELADAVLKRIELLR